MKSGKRNEREFSMSEEPAERELTQEELEEAGRYAIIIEWSPEDDAFVVSVPDVPGIHTHGPTREDAAIAGDRVLALLLSARHKSGRPIPPPVFNARYATHTLPPVDDAEHIRAIRQRLNVSQRDFAEMLNVSLGTVRSWEQGLRSPDGASLRLLDIAECQPDVLAEVSAARPRRSKLTA